MHGRGVVDSCTQLSIVSSVWLTMALSQFAGGRKPFSSVSFSWAPEQMGWAYFPAYWAYITVQLVFIRPDPTVRSQ
jgi:hypothetical protein